MGPPFGVVIGYLFRYTTSLLRLTVVGPGTYYLGGWGTSEVSVVGVDCQTDSGEPLGLRLGGSIR